VNGDDLRQATHEKAILSLMRPTREIHLVVRHDPQPDGFQVSYVQPVVFCGTQPDGFQVGYCARVATNRENLEYSGISVKMENSGNSQGILCNLREKL